MVTLPPPDVSSVAGRAPRPERHVEIVVIGAGPAGCAAALAAARAGAEVLLVDEHPVDPGLIGLDAPYLFGGRATAATQNPARLVETLLENNPALMAAMEQGVDVALSTAAWGAWVNGPGIGALPAPLVGLACATRSWFVSFDRLIVATGARDLNLCFEGAGQPGVMGAQGLHALLARYDAFAGRRLVILGTGPLAVATADLALARGVAVAAMVEARDAPQAPAEALARLAAAGVEIVVGHAPLRATGGPHGVTGLALAPTGGGAPREIACDTVCLAVGVVPMIELLDVLGAARTLDPARGGHAPVLGPGGAASAPGGSIRTR
jgi:thioredoxin reductase